MADRDTRDAIEADMAAHQRRFSGEVTASKNESLAADALRELDRVKAESPAVAPAEPIAQPERFTQKRELNGHTYTIDKAPDKTPMYRSATDFEANVLKHAMPRVKLLLSKQDEGPFGTPSWRTRAMAAFYFKIKSHEAATSHKTDEADLYERIYQQDLYELLEASNQPFGDWRKAPTPEPKITIAVK